MARRSRYPVRKNATQGRGRSGVGKRQVTRPPSSVASGQLASSRNVTNAPIAPDRIQQTIPLQPHVVREIKRILVIAGVMILILAILSIIL